MKISLDDIKIGPMLNAYSHADIPWVMERDLQQHLYTIVRIKAYKITIGIQQIDTLWVDNSTGKRYLSSQDNSRYDNDLNARKAIYRRMRNIK
jgi:hypothetical protein